MNKYDELIEDIVDICLEKLRHDKKYEESMKLLILLKISC